MFRYFFLAILAACIAMPVTVTFAQDKRTAKIMKPAALKSLKLPRERAAAIKVGRQGQKEVRAHMSRSNKFAAADGQSKAVCVGGVCVCSGDKSCNDMFTTICSNSSSGGVCTGEPPICACTPASN